MVKEKLHVKDKDIAVPGDLLAEGMSFLPAGRAYRDDKKLYASTTGLIKIKGKVIKVIPLAGAYVPKAGDDVIGKIDSISHNRWAVDIGGPFNADLNIGEASNRYIDLNKTSLADIYDVGDWVLARVKEITNSGYVKLSTKDRKYKKLTSGNVIQVSPTKIPRIIGKKGSMIGMIKNVTDCKIYVGQNGYVWTDGKVEDVAKVGRAVKYIEENSHKSGLTDTVKDMLGGGKSSKKSSKKSSAATKSKKKKASKKKKSKKKKSSKKGGKK